MNWKKYKNNFEHIKIWIIYEEIFAKMGERIRDELPRNPIERRSFGADD